MKKKYITPECVSVALNSNVMMSAGSSLNVDTDVKIDDEDFACWSHEFGGTLVDDSKFPWD